MNSICLAILFLIHYMQYLDSVRHHVHTIDNSLPAPFSTHILFPPIQKPSRINSRRKLEYGHELTPLYPGYGTHFSYIYVGTPPQRQSVIIDTGSHYTAFPCKGCSQCGQHTDSYWDIENSSTSEVQKCLNNQPCVISQSYTEGSSWHAIKVKDVLWVGGTGPTLVPDADKYKIDFLFGCQTMETGLFRTQLADGIMGMSMADDTLPNQLKKQSITNNRVFALCFRSGGGIMTLGGVDQKIHLKHSALEYVKLDSKSNGWYGVTIIDIQLVSQDGIQPTVTLPLQEDPNKYNSGKGVIVDSGTTDTYLPQEISNKFNDLFHKISGVTFSSGNVKLSAEQLGMLPNIVFVFEGVEEGQSISIMMPWTNYVDSVGDDKYSFRIYLTEKIGTVLGSNFMNGYNVIFDQDGQRIGFAKSTCNYEEFGIPVTFPPTTAPTEPPAIFIPPTQSTNDDQVQSNPNPPVSNKTCSTHYLPYTDCTAKCTRNESAYRVVGIQDWVNICEHPFEKVEHRECIENCSYSRMVRGNDYRCPDEPWSECAHSCFMSRRSVPLTELPPKSPSMNLVYNEGFLDNPLKKSRQLQSQWVRKDTESSIKCLYVQQTRTCYTGRCPIEDGDYLVYIDLWFKLSASKWSYLYSELFTTATSQLFNLRGQVVEILNDASNSYKFGTKLHFQIRLRIKDYKNNKILLHDAAEKLVDAVRDKAVFGTRLLSKLDELSKAIDHDAVSRFGWMNGNDFEVISAVAMPVGGVRDPDLSPAATNTDVKNSKELSTDSKIGLFILGMAATFVLILSIVLYLHYKLRQEYFAMSKEKSFANSGSGTLRNIWQRITNPRVNRQTERKGISMNSLERAEYDHRMSKKGLMQEVDSDEDVQ